MAIKDYNKSPDENIEINGIDIGEGCAPNGVNNAIRQIMADLADSIATNPVLMKSNNANNAISVGSDNLLYIPSGTPVTTNPKNLISSQSGNMIKLGTDNKLYVDPKVGDTMSWSQVTGKPSQYSPEKHASTHLPGGSDPITFSTVPVGLIGMFRGTAAEIPAGWVLCNGQNGTPNLTDRFIIAAGGSYPVGQTGGSNTVRVSGTTGVATGDGSKLANHYHSVPTAVEVRKPATTDEGRNLRLLAGYASTDQVQYLPTGGAGEQSVQSHSHTFSASAPIMPPFYALAFIQYKGV